MTAMLPPDWKPDERLVVGVLLLLARAHLALDEMGVPRAVRRDELERTTW